MSIDLSLERLKRLVLHLPPYSRPTIHIAGTNGKGSVSALLTSILLASQPTFRIGRYNSPHLITVRDCITIDNKAVSLSVYEETRKDVEDADREHGTHLSNFELLTLTALLVFERAAVDIVILEVGMGGRLDATNIVPSSCILASVLTAVDLDHQAFLGNTVAEIAREKAGIARAGKPFILGSQSHPEVGDVVIETLTNVGGVISPSVLVEQDTDDNIGFSLFTSSQLGPGGQRITAHIPNLYSASPLHASLPLQGAHQRDNLATALAVINALLSEDSTLSFCSRITPKTIKEGIRNVSWPGRLSFHTLNIPSKGVNGSNHIDKLLVLADGAHNPASAETLGAYIRTLLESTRQSLPSLSKPLPITYLLGLSHSPPKTPLQTLAPIFAPIQQTHTTSSLDIRLAVALLPFTPPDGMPWVKSVPTSTMRETVSGLLPTLKEQDIWCSDTSSSEHANLNIALDVALRWAATRHLALGGYMDGGEQVSGLVVLSGSLYLVADLYRLMENGPLAPSR